MAKKRINGWLIGTCQKSGEEDLHLTYSHRTREYLIDPELVIREREVTAKRKIRQEEQEKNRWDELTSGTGS